MMNRQVLLATRPESVAQARDFAIRSAPVPDPEPGEIVVRNHYLSVGQLRQWIGEGRICWREDILDGIKACPDALAGLYRGENKGKRLIRLQERKLA